MALIFYLSSSTREVSYLPKIEGLDKVLHFIAYGCLGFWFWFAFIMNQWQMQVVLPILFSTLYGLSDEYHQSYVPGRSSDFYDIVADFSGALFIVFVANCLYLYFKKQKAPSY